ncbi:BatD family protein [Flavilitoribacter nigricans]|uniref:Protein BatD n=1 Tax=Flavilitoribacter nigricans (strain ATCC 23147 / DSM 23189 / NBRC 102662 / NCIMB 1420 / SS-2) TaxID=1122177 RepID=A0A2D0N3U8_FLAN2|nr:BatD family protein [Flavilitoribacter nigricans]PHN03117.1 hypothetical protein CRP01_28985 [Flavilitoribacter nigricans DSM 23189 = NBRC 102662]
MKRTLLGLLFLIGITAGLAAQEGARFTVEVSTDSILFGNYFKVTFSLENARGGEFSAPDFSEFRVVSGPNQASSMSIVNGQVTQSISYAYYLEPKDLGNFYILPASVAVGDKVMETQPIEVMVVPNPENIRQSPDNNSGFNMQQFGFEGMDSWGDGMPDLNQINEMFRNMMPNGGDMDGFQFFQDSMPSFNLDEFFRMMPELRMQIPEELQEGEQPKEGKRKKKRKIYKV